MFRGSFSRPARRLARDIITADLSVPGSAAELAARVGTLGRTIDILINNAGVGLSERSMKAN